MASRRAERLQRRHEYAQKLLENKMVRLEKAQQKELNEMIARHALDWNSLARIVQPSMRAIQAATWQEGARMRLDHRLTEFETTCEHELYELHQRHATAKEDLKLVHQLDVYFFVCTCDACSFSY
jgi:hypothetical protein